VRKFLSIGTADDMLDADGFQTLTFAQAQEAARAWFASLIEPKGAAIDQITVADAMTAYVADYMVQPGREAGRYSRGAAGGGLAGGAGPAGRFCPVCKAGRAGAAKLKRQLQ